MKLLMFFLMSVGLSARSGGLRAGPESMAADLALCGPPWPAVFSQDPSPVLAPEKGYEQNCVMEPNVILGPDGLYHMAYSCDAFAEGGRFETIGLATSQDLIHWTRYGDAPLLGNGYGGIAGAVSMASQLKIGPEYRIYFSDHDSGSVDYATSKDGYHYRYSGTAIPLDPQSITIPSPRGGDALCARPRAYDSCGFVHNGKDWWALVEVAAFGWPTGRSSRCPGQPGYLMWLFRSKDGAHTFTPASKSPLASITASVPLPGNVIYAGGRASFKAGGTYYTFPHIDYPTLIGLSKSKDLIHWRTYPWPVITWKRHLFGLKACNQAADASVIEANGRTYLFYDGTDNDHGAARIGVAVFPGSEADLDGCSP